MSAVSQAVFIVIISATIASANPTSVQSQEVPRTQDEIIDKSFLDLRTKRSEINRKLEELKIEQEDSQNTLKALLTSKANLENDLKNAEARIVSLSFEENQELTYQNDDRSRAEEALREINAKIDSNGSTSTCRLARRS